MPEQQIDKMVVDGNDGTTMQLCEKSLLQPDSSSTKGQVRCEANGDTKNTTKMNNDVSAIDDCETATRGLGKVAEGEGEIENSKNSSGQGDDAVDEGRLGENVDGAINGDNCNVEENGDNIDEKCSPSSSGQGEKDQGEEKEDDNDDDEGNENDLVAAKELENKKETQSIKDKDVEKDSVTNEDKETDISNESANKKETKNGDCNENRSDDKKDTPHNKDDKDKCDKENDDNDKDDKGETLASTEDSAGDANVDEANRQSVIVTDAPAGTSQDGVQDGGQDEDICITKVGHDPALRRLYLNRVDRVLQARQNVALSLFAQRQRLQLGRGGGGEGGRAVGGSMGNEASAAILIDSAEDSQLDDSDISLMDVGEGVHCREVFEEGLSHEDDDNDDDDPMPRDTSSDSSVDETENMYLKRRKMDRHRRYQAQKRRRLHQALSREGGGGGGAGFSMGGPDISRVRDTVSRLAMNMIAADKPGLARAPLSSAPVPPVVGGAGAAAEADQRLMSGPNQDLVSMVEQMREAELQLYQPLQYNNPATASAGASNNCNNNNNNLDDGEENDEDGASSDVILIDSDE